MYRTLVAEVVRCVNQGIEWRDVYQIESYYLTNYGYNSIKKSYRRI